VLRDEGVQHLSDPIKRENKPTHSVTARATREFEPRSSVTEFTPITVHNIDTIIFISV